MALECRWYAPPPFTVLESDELSTDYLQLHWRSSGPHHFLHFGGALPLVCHSLEVAQCTRSGRFRCCRRRARVGASVVLDQ